MYRVQLNSEPRDEGELDLNEVEEDTEEEEAESWFQEELAEEEEALSLKDSAAEEIQPESLLLQETAEPSQVAMNDDEELSEDNLEGSETVLALTNDDENNMMACVLAEKTGLKKRTIAIVNKTNYNLLQDSLNIDDLVDPRLTTVSRIMENVHRGSIGTVNSL